MRNHKSIVIGVALSLLFCVLPARAAAPLVWIATGASGLSAGPPEQLDDDPRRVELPTGMFEYDYSFQATLWILKPDGKEQLEEATCYLKTDKRPPPNDIKTKKPPTKEEWASGVCAGA